MLQWVLQQATHIFHHIKTLSLSRLDDRENIGRGRGRGPRGGLIPKELLELSKESPIPASSLVISGRVSHVKMDTRIFGTIIFGKDSAHVFEDNESWEAVEKLHSSREPGGKWLIAVSCERLKWLERDSLSSWRCYCTQSRCTGAVKTVTRRSRLRYLVSCHRKQKL